MRFSLLVAQRIREVPVLVELYVIPPPHAAHILLDRGEFAARRHLPNQHANLSRPSFTCTRAALPHTNLHTPERASRPHMRAALSHTSHKPAHAGARLASTHLSSHARAYTHAHTRPRTQQLHMPEHTLMYTPVLTPVKQRRKQPMLAAAPAPRCS